MPVIDHIDPATRRIFLSAATVGVDLQPLEIYQELRVLRSTTESLRPFDMFAVMQGHEPKDQTGTKFTPRRLVLQLGTRLVPFDTDQTLTIIGEIISDDGFEGTALFDRTLLSPTTNVDINYIPPQVEIIEVSTTGSNVNSIITAIFNNIMENGESFKEQQNLIRAALVGLVNVSPDGNTFTFRNAADTKDRIVSFN